MNEEQRREIIEVMESVVRDAGFDLYDGARRIARYMDRKRPLIDATQSREVLDAYLASINAPDEAELFIMLALLRSFPALAKQFINEGVVKAASTIPATLGPPRKLTPEIEREIVARVGKLHTDGVRMGIAQSRVAQQLGLGKRTVQAVWGKRQHLAAQPFRSMNDVWEFFMRSAHPSPPGSGD